MLSTVFLYQNLVAEMVSEYPSVGDIWDHLHNRYMDRIEFVDLMKDIMKFQDSSKAASSFIDALIDNDYFRLSNTKTGEIYKNFANAEHAYETTYKKIPPSAVRICQESWDIWAVMDTGFFSFEVEPLFVYCHAGLIVLPESISIRRIIS